MFSTPIILHFPSLLSFLSSPFSLPHSLLLSPFPPPSSPPFPLNSFLSSSPPSPQNEHKLEITMLSYDVAILYSFFMQQTKVKDRMTKPWESCYTHSHTLLKCGNKTRLGKYSYPFFEHFSILSLPSPTSSLHPLSSSSLFLSLSLPTFYLSSLSLFFTNPSSLPLSLSPLSLRMSEVAQTASKKPIRPGVRNLVLDMCCSDENGEDVDVPYIKYSF